MKWILTTLIALLCASNIMATLCVGPAATGSGNGADWNNLKAWSATPTRGDTWLLVDGTYTGKTFSTATNGTLVTTIQKATVASHGGISTGWLDTMGDGQAVFSNSIQFESSYWTFDGQVGGGPSVGWTTGYGYRINESGDTTAVIRCGWNGSVANNLIIQHVEMHGAGHAVTGGGSLSNDGFALYNGSNITISYIYMTQIGRCPWFGSTANTLCEYVYSDSFYGSSSVHSCIASLWSFSQTIGTWTFRYCLFTASDSTGGIMWDNSHDHNAQLRVYGCVFYRPTGVSWSNANGQIGGWQGGGNEDCYNMRIYNNVFINVNVRVFTDFQLRFGNNEAKNNLFYNSNSPIYDTIPVHDYNHYNNSGGLHGEPNATSTTGGNPFTNYTGLVFTLVANTAAGASPGVPYNVDPLNNVRTTYTRGAYEYQAADAGIVLDPYYHGHHAVPPGPRPGGISAGGRESGGSYNTEALTADTAPWTPMYATPFYNLDGSPDYGQTYRTNTLLARDPISAVAYILPAYAQVDAAGTSLTLGFTSNVTAGGAGFSSGFAITTNGDAATATYASGDGTDTLVYTVSATVNIGDVLTLAYTQPGTGLKDNYANSVATFSGLAIRNLSEVP